ncbi:MAG: hypothetical protein ACREBO_04750 [Novosphingobium sp.]
MFRGFICTLAVAPLACAALAPAAADALEQLDRLSLASADPDQGLALARQQAASGALLDALATLERTIAGHPKTKRALLLHASILCRIDDRVGGEVEFARLKAKDFSKAEWAEARTPCEGAGQ